MSGKPRVLYICHNHPSVRPGGAEAYALELYEGMRARREFEPTLVARTDSRLHPHPGTQFGLVNSDPCQYFAYTDGFSYDWVYGSITDKEYYTKHFREFLLAQRPSIVHFQHTLFFGYDLLREVRNSLPDVPIVYTLHEYLPICHRQGQMVRTVNGEELCDSESPQRCHECFPDVSRQTFFMRKRFIQSHLSLVDVFLAPCHFLRRRFIEWGIPAERIRFEEYGRQPVAPLAEVDECRSRNRFAYFGQLNPFKGSHVVFNAVQFLAEANAKESEPALDFQVRVHGANLDIQAGSYQNEFRNLLQATKDHVTMVGRYTHDQLPQLMTEIDWVIVPSIWWENSPLVIQEAFAYRKPVLCSNIGGMAEKVTDRVNGLHFRVNDSRHLADTMRVAVNTPGLWESLREGIRPPYAMVDHVEALSQLYRELCHSKLRA